MKPAIAFALLSLAGCAALPQEPTHLTGAWGGPHVGLVFAGGFAQLQYDCASGTIDEAIVPGPDGSFTASGTHRPGHGGPVRVGQIFVSHRAEYRGTVEGSVMRLSATLENGQLIGPYTLVQGAQPQITRCL